MRALVYHGPGTNAWEEVATPALRADTDAIVRVEAVTICGTDLHILKGDVPAVTDGRILGHEAVGTVELVGAAVRNVKVGGRVLVSCITTCGACRLCREARYGQCLGGAAGSWGTDRRGTGRVRAGPLRRLLHPPGPGRRRRRGAAGGRTKGGAGVRGPG